MCVCVCGGGGGGGGGNDCEANRRLAYVASPLPTLITVGKALEHTPSYFANITLTQDMISC